MNTVSTPVIDCNQVFAALETWIKQRPGLDPADYGLAPGQTPDWKMRLDMQRAYRAEIRAIGNDRKRALKALDEARSLMPARPDVLMDSFRAYSGRLRCNGTELDYCTGQYWPTEYRKAAASVLETYIAGWKQADATENPPTFTYRSMEDVIAANRAIGNHWFDRDTMRFFKTRIESGLIAGHRFITSEKGPDGVRRYSVREACPDGTIDTVGEFQQYRTRDQARANVLK